MRTWKELTAIALEGTAKSAAGAEAERRLLNEAGWHMLRQLAGRRPAKFTVAEERQAPQEAQPLVSRAAALRLEEILRTDDREHVDEWLELAAAAGKRVPPSLLPPLLEQAAVRSDLRAPTLHVGGGRVSWLAHQNEEWAFADIADPLEAFHSGVRAARVAALAELRSHDPAAALATLAEGWQKEGGDDRAALIPVLAVGLGPADEGFLTMASNDGRKEVRAGARDLLARLPESALIARMIQRADACFRFRRGVLGGKLEVNPPAECDAGMVADGIEPKAPKGVGERAYWMRQVLALVPPSHWPPDYFNAGVKSDWAEALLIGWSEAAVRFQDAKWCALLIEHFMDVRNRQPQRQLPSLQELIRAMPRPAIEAAIVDQLRRSPAHALDLALRRTERLSPHISAALMGQLERALTVRDATYQQQWIYTMTGYLKTRLDPSILPQVVALADRSAQAANEWASQALQRLAATLEYRAAMAREILS
ncbi:MAG: hypothetical protein E6J28_03970 [Chloroflexi bacterium]|nr:MAG: hypothetical protein E6J28_03970 [Chloroflexota bacterium]